MTSTPSDPYKVLQVDPEAEPEVIRAAYRTLALKYHPDLSPGSQERMAAINQAWLILRDADSRALHDRARTGAWRPPGGQQPVVAYPMPGPVPATPPGTPSGSVLEFGRYSGWSLGQILGVDPEYLEWLARAPIGSSFKREIQQLWATRAVRRVAAARAAATARGAASR